MVRGTYFLSPGGPMLEVGAKIREAASYYSSPGHSGPAVTWITVWLPGLVARDSGLSFILVTADGRLAFLANGCRLWVRVQFLHT